MKEEIYDTIIVGAGVSGLAASIYASRFNLKTLILSERPGGLILEASLVENYPGIPSLPGYELAKKILDHAKAYNQKPVIEAVLAIEKKSNIFEVKTNKNLYKTKTIIIAIGSKHRSLEVKGEEEFKGKGVSYCALCDGALYKDKIVAVVGGMDSAVKEALLLAEYAKKVYIIYRKEKIRAEPINLKKLEENKKIEVITSTNITEICGDEIITSVVLDKPYKGKTKLDINGLFVAIGHSVDPNLAKSLKLNVNDKNEIIIDKMSKTSVSGVFAAGDCTDFPWKQAITGVAQGTVAAFSAYDFIKEKN